MHTCRITDGTFGNAEYFKDLVDNVNDMSKSNDWFLLANDFAGYMKAQDEVDKVRLVHHYMPPVVPEHDTSKRIKCYV